MWIIFALVAALLASFNPIINKRLLADTDVSVVAWAGCVAGAVEADEYIGMMKSVGFTDISVVPVFFDKETVDSALSDMKDVVELKTVSRDDVYKAVYSAKITAYKPQ